MPRWLVGERAGVYVNRDREMSCGMLYAVQVQQAAQWRDEECSRESLSIQANFIQFCITQESYLSERTLARLRNEAKGKTWLRNGAKAKNSQEWESVDRVSVVDGERLHFQALVCFLAFWFLMVCACFVAFG